jgi:hypothetical protein
LVVVTNPSQLLQTSSPTGVAASPSHHCSPPIIPPASSSSSVPPCGEFGFLQAKCLLGYIASAKIYTDHSTTHHPRSSIPLWIWVLASKVFAGLH